MTRSWSDTSLSTFADLRTGAQQAAVRRVATDDQAPSFNSEAGVVSGHCIPPADCSAGFFSSFHVDVVHKLTKIAN